MTYILAKDELTVPVYSSRRKKSSPCRRQNSSENPGRAPMRRRITSSETSSRESIKSESATASTVVEDVVFPAHEPIRPVFCCTSVKSKDPEYACKIGTATSTIQRGSMCNFRKYIAEHSQSKGIPVDEDLKWQEGADYFVKVVQYQQKGESNHYASEKKVYPTKKVKGLRKRKELIEEESVEREQAAPGRYFVETKHKKGKRRPCHAFKEILITENLDGIPACFERVEEITMEAMCSVHSGRRKWICEFWGKAAVD